MSIETAFFAACLGSFLFDGVLYRIAKDPDKPLGARRICAAVFWGLLVFQVIVVFVAVVRYIGR